MFYFNKFFTKLLSSTMRVSILILLDVLLQQKLEQFLSLAEEKFQSLFYWMFYFNIQASKYPETLLMVSILILLDVLLQLLQLECGTDLDTCFNPYFTGCSTSTQVAEKTKELRAMFQSLFYWMFYFNPLRMRTRRWA